MEPNNTTGTPLPDASQLNAAGGTPAVGTAPTTTQGTAPSTDAMSLKEINATLGKDFKDVPTALKAFQDTFSFVGKRKEDIKSEVLAEIQKSDRTNELSTELKAIRTERFFEKNADYDKPEIRKFIEATGQEPAAVITTPEFKSIFDKVVEHDKSVKLRTVLESNPRLASSRDSLTKAQELASSAVDITNPAHRRAREQAGQLAVDAVKSAFDL